MADKEERKVIAVEQLQRFKEHLDSEFSNLEEQVDTKQTILVSGENIKTINGESLLGSGDITTSGTTGIPTFTPTTFELNFNRLEFTVYLDEQAINEIIYEDYKVFGLGPITEKSIHSIHFTQETLVQTNNYFNLIKGYQLLAKDDNNELYLLCIDFYTEDNHIETYMIKVGGDADIEFASTEDIEEMFLENFYVTDNHSSYVEISNWDFWVKEGNSYHQEFNIYNETQVFDRDNSYVLMGGEDITSDVLSYDNKWGQINIPEVTNNIEYGLYSKLDTDNYYTIQWNMEYGVHAENPVEYHLKNDDFTIVLIPELPYTEVSAHVYDEFGQDLGITFVDGVATINTNSDIRIWAQGSNQVNCWNISGDYNGVANSNDAWLVRADIPSSYNAHLYSNYDDNRKAVEAQIEMDNGGNGVYEDITATAYNPYSQDIDINEVTGNVIIHGNAVMARNVTVYQSFTPQRFIDFPGEWLNVNLPLHLRCEDDDIPMQAIVTINGSQWVFNSYEESGSGVNVLDFTVSSEDLHNADPDGICGISIELTTEGNAPVRYMSYENKAEGSISYINPIYRVLNGHDLTVTIRTEENSGLNCGMDIYRWNESTGEYEYLDGVYGQAYQGVHGIYYEATWYGNYIDADFKFEADFR